MAQPSQATRGDETRNQLLEAGLELFSRYGYESVSTRQLSQEAGTNIAAIAYHFGGKRELYRAILQQLVEDTEAHLGPGVAALHQGIIDAAGDRQRLAELMARFVGQIIKMFLNDSFMTCRAPLVMREYTHPSEDFDIIYEARLKPLHLALTEFCAAAIGSPPDAPECAIRAHTIMGQVVCFSIARIVLFRRLDWDSYTPERAEEVARVVTQSILSSLGLPHQPADRPQENPRGN